MFSALRPADRAVLAQIASTGEETLCAEVFVLFVFSVNSLVGGPVANRVVQAPVMPISISLSAHKPLSLLVYTVKGLGKKRSKIETFYICSLSQEIEVVLNSYLGELLRLEQLTAGNRGL